MNNRIWNVAILDYHFAMRYPVLGMYNFGCDFRNDFNPMLNRARHSLLYYIILQYTWIDLSSDLGDFVTVSRGLLSIPYFCLIASRTFSLATSSRSLCFCLSFWKALRAFSLNRKREKTVKWQNLNQRDINNSHLVSFRRRCARVRRCAGMQSGN